MVTARALVSPYPWIVARFEANGALDPTFGTDGMEMQPDGRILVTDIAQVRRYTTVGERDATFGTDGLVTYGADVDARGLRVMPDGDLLVVGNQSHDALAMRLTSSGA